MSDPTRVTADTGFRFSDPVDPVSRAFMVAYDEWSDENRAVALGTSPRGNLKELRRALDLAYENLPPVTIPAEDTGGRSRPEKTSRLRLERSDRRYRGRRVEEGEGDDP